MFVGQTEYAGIFLAQIFLHAGVVTLFSFCSSFLAIQNEMSKR